MSLYFKDSKIKKIYHGSTKVKKIYFGSTKVWSSGSEVTYFSEDGSTVLGTADVDEGEDVLHPTMVTPTKANHTFVGWVGYGGTERFETKVANGEPMSLYALFVPNSLQILNASLIVESGDVDPKYTLVSYNNNYIDEVKYAESSSWYNYEYSNSDTKTMHVKIGLYQLMTVQGRALKNHNEGGGSINNVTSSGNTVTLTFGADADIVMYCWNRHEWRESWSHTITGCTNITLSNPDAWELPQPTQ